MEKPNLKVIIIGGSIAGLTLAHCLEVAGIDYTVLEKHRDILVTIGGSVGLLPNGSRILEQLGVYERLETVGCPVKIAHSTYPDGFVFSDDWPETIWKRKVPLATYIWQLIQALYDTLKDPSRVRTGQRVARIETRAHGVSVFIETGKEYQGDVVVGADGVHSVTRSQMWQAAELSLPGIVSEKERHILCSEYSCVLGLSSPVKGLNPGEQVIACHDNTAILLFPGKDREIGWGLVQKLDKRSTSSEPHRFSHDEVLAKGQAAAELRLYRDIKFKDIWAKTTKYSSTTLEEGLLGTWHYGRIVCVGDSVSKMTPNLAQGANTAIEGAAALANVLQQISVLREPSEHEISRLLQSYAERQKRRLRRVHAVSYSATRLHTRRNWIWKLWGRYVYPNTPNAILHTLGGIITQAPFLSYVPLPKRAFNPVSKIFRPVNFMNSLASGFPGISLSKNQCSARPFR
ncbi:hypothetical protein BDV12DRAFT_188603 [Aspergillus spectabilis]